MIVAAVVVTAVGAALATAGALWLFFGLSPTDPRFRDDGMLYPGRQESSVVPALLRAQRRPAALVGLGTSTQLVGAVLAILASI
jgi:hypothetical protein